MRQIPLFEVKNKLSFFVDLAQQGERIEITKHGKTSAVLVGAENQTTTDDVSNSPFYLAYLKFREKMNFNSFSDEEWKKTFEIERNETGLRHPEDFE
ncbi:MAG: type II toxin-antitoxin system prevent-host-death family antitoxin [Treponema sp.]|nr:type II toxin-antitoxin system prevent-host-death family antitoxin [Treponema sp.]